MAAEQHYLAIDLGAESGRAILGTVRSDKLEIQEMHRFTTGGVSLPNRRFSEVQPGRAESSLFWDFLRFWQEIMHSLHTASSQFSLASVGVDSWGVDFGLIDHQGNLAGYPYHYRDNRTDGMPEKAFERLSRERIYEITGIQFMQINTLYQLLAMKLNHAPQLQIADKLVMVPDIINYWLTGQILSEFSEATTSQMVDLQQKAWSTEIIQAMGFPASLFPPIINSGTIIGPIRPVLQAELGCGFQVVAPPTHDTASAVAAVPAESDSHVWISSGTWSIAGITTPEPIINDLAYAHNLTNEGGRAGTNCFSKNISGMWLIQQCRSQWQREGQDFSYTELTEMAEKAPPLVTIVNPESPRFLEVGNMVERINDYCLSTHQPLPTTRGEIIRAILQGLALCYRYTIDQLEKASGITTDTIHIVGGGSRNYLLNQFTADATGRKVVTGPIEATAVGNIISQSIAMGDIANWQQGVAVIRNSFPIDVYLPGDQAPWDQAYIQFLERI